MIGVMIPPMASSSPGIAGLMSMPMLTMHTDVIQSPFRHDPQRGTQSGRVGSLASQANPFGSGSGASLDLNLAFRD
jgi:hypothetical protein